MIVEVEIFGESSSDPLVDESMEQPEQRVRTLGTEQRHGKDASNHETLGTPQRSTRSVATSAPSIKWHLPLFMWSSLAAPPRTSLLLRSLSATLKFTTSPGARSLWTIVKSEPWQPTSDLGYILSRQYLISIRQCARIGQRSRDDKRVCRPAVLGDCSSW